MSDHIKIDIDNRIIFREKNLIRKIYYDYFRKIKDNIYYNSKNKILEIGSSGFIKDIIPECVTSNLVKNDEMIDKEINVFNLSNKEIYSNIIMVDIFHHLEFPMLALKNLHNVLCKNGRVILIEPAMGFFPRLIYKIFHHEPNGFNLKINCSENITHIPDKNEYFAAQALTWRVFVNDEIDYRKYFYLKKIDYFSDFSYLGSGGFSFKAFYPEKLYFLIKKMDKILNLISRKLFAARMLIVLEKK